MITRSVYAPGGFADQPPLTDEPCEHAPQEGVHLYHFPLSLCSQKVRQVLDEKGVSWRSHVIQLKLYEQYEPAYVRINPRCVVPTLVCDGRVTTDSENILRHVDARFPGSLLVPEDAGERERMEAFLHDGDAMFIEALTYGDIPGVRKPLGLRLYARGNHEAKAKVLADLVERSAGDAFLEAAYAAKLAAVEATLSTMGSEKTMAEVIALTWQQLDRLEESLGADDWLCGAAFTLADIEWGAILNRLALIGLDEGGWGGRTKLAGYAARLSARPSFKTAVADWGNPLTRILLPAAVKGLQKRIGLSDA